MPTLAQPTTKHQAKALEYLCQRVADNPNRDPHEEWYLISRTQWREAAGLHPKYQAEALRECVGRGWVARRGTYTPGGRPMAYQLLTPHLLPPMSTQWQPPTPNPRWRMADALGDDLWHWHQLATPDLTALWALAEANPARAWGWAPYMAGRPYATYDEFSHRAHHSYGGLPAAARLGARLRGGLGRAVEVDVAGCHLGLVGALAGYWAAQGYPAEPPATLPTTDSPDFRPVAAFGGDIGHWLGLFAQGRLRAQIGALVGYTDERTKAWLMRALYGKWHQGKAWGMFAKAWPTVVGYILAAQRAWGGRGLAQVAQAVEVVLMLGVAAAQVRAAGVPYYTVHDCLGGPTKALGVLRAAIVAAWAGVGLGVCVRPNYG
jgi:hypothetical protein